MGMFDLIKSMADAEVDFVLVGGLAVALHGYQRVTMDVDVVLAMKTATGRGKDAIDIEELRKLQAQKT